jgi:hypothetical protein
MAITGKFEADFSSYIAEVNKANASTATFQTQATDAATAANAIGASSSVATTGVAELATATTALAGAQDLATLSNEQLDAMIAGETVALQASTVATVEATTASGAYGSVLFTTAEAEVAATEAAAGLTVATEGFAATMTALIGPITAVVVVFDVLYLALKKYLDASEKAIQTEADFINKQDVLERAAKASGHEVSNLAQAVKILEEVQRHQLLLDPALAAQDYIDKLSEAAKKVRDLAAEEAARSEGLANVGLVVGGPSDVVAQMKAGLEAQKKAAQEEAQFEQRLNEDTARKLTKIYDDIAKSFYAMMKDQEAQLKRSNQNTVDLVKSFTKLGDVQREAFGPTEAFLGGIEKVGTAFKVTQGQMEESMAAFSTDVGPTLDQAASHANDFGKAFSDNISKSLQSLPNLIQQALTGGGGLKGAIEAFGADIGADLGKSLVTHFGTDISKTFEDLLGQGIGGAVGGFINDILPGLGSVLSLALNKLFSIGGPSAQETAGRNIVADLQKQFGSTTDFINKVGQAYADIGKTREQAQADIKAAWDAERQGAAATQAAVDKLNEALKRSGEIESDISSLGIKSHDELIHAADIANATYQKIYDGVKTGQYTAEDATKAYIAYQQALADAGDAAAKAWLATTQAQTTAATAVDSNLQKLISQRDSLNQSIGQEAPEAQIGVIEQQQRAQRDALDVQIKDAQSAAQTAADATTAAAQTSADQQKVINSDLTGYVHAQNTDTANALQNDFTSAAQTAADNIKSEFDFTIHIPIAFDTPSLPVSPQASGGDYLVTKPTLFLAGEAGPERATFTPQGGSSGPGGGPITVQVVLDGRVVAENTINRMAQDKYGAGIKTKRALGLPV